MKNPTPEQKLLQQVVNLFGREYGAGKKYGTYTLGGRLLEEIREALAKENLLTEK